MNSYTCFVLFRCLHAAAAVQEQMQPQLRICRLAAYTRTQKIIFRIVSI